MENPTQNLTNRTFMCAVVFIDIVEYSKKPVAQQVTIKNRFNAIVGKGLENIATSDRIILDTGDGAALCFLGDPEDGLFVTNSLRNDFAAEPPNAGLQVRIGINLGPVKVMRDLNGNPNIVGDGINVAQRVMSFAQPNQILVSRSYFEVVSRLTQEYSQLFRFIGAREDKHVREHELYEVAVGGSSAAAAEPVVVDVPPDPAPAQQSTHDTSSHTAQQAAQIPVPKKSRTGLYVGLAALAVFVVAVGIVALLDEIGGRHGDAPVSDNGRKAKRDFVTDDDSPPKRQLPREVRNDVQPPVRPNVAPVPTAQPATGVYVNGRQLTQQEVQQHQQTYGNVQQGSFWYDRTSGLYGYVGREAAGYIRPGHNNYGSMAVNASNGNTGVYLNGRHLNMTEVAQWQNIFGRINPGRYWLDGVSGNVGVEGNPTPTGNVQAAIQAAMARYRR